MTRFEWNGLRIGDAVFVHHPWAEPATADPGVVELITVRAHLGNEVGIRMSGGDHQVMWPTWLTTHRELVAHEGSCWRCEAVASARVA